MSSLYIHIPFCLRKCHYCDFYSCLAEGSGELDEYLQLLLRELELLVRRQPLVRPLRTLFFGGGTPSLLSADQVVVILGRLSELIGIADDCEISLEANPGTLTAERLVGYRQAGISRLSLGVQSLRDENLQLLGRIHSSDEARQAVADARSAGFADLSLDLIFALPGQSLEQLQEDVEGLLALQPEHLSLYGLTIEPETLFAERLQAGELSEIPEQLYAESYLLLHRQLVAAGFEHYEISNFARPGSRCRHNQVYWQRQQCLSLGCGAHSFIASGWGERWHVPQDLPAYRQKLRRGEAASELLESFDRQSAMAEVIYLALRTADGLSREQFRRQFGIFPERQFADAFQHHSDRLHLRDDCWCFDLQGWLLYDHLISAFL